MNTLTFARTSTSAHDLFEEFFAEVEGAARAPTFRPVVDVAEADDAFVLRLDLPGLSREDIRIETRSATLSISGHRKPPAAGKGYRYCESGYGDFARDFSLPERVDRDRIDTRYDNGVLEVRLAFKAAA